MKRTLLACLLLIALVATVSGTVAYFTDNVQTQGSIASGNLDIIQHEYERVKDDSGKYTIQPYTQKQIIYPSVTPTSSEHTQVVTVNEHTVKLLDEAHRNFIDKIVVAENTGSLNAYVRTFVAIPAHYYLDANKQEQSVNWLHLDVNKEGWVWASDPVRNVMIDGICYDIHYATYENVLAPGQFTPPSLLGFYLDSNVSQKKQNYTYKNEDGEINLGPEAALTILVATEASQANVFEADSTRIASVVAMDETYGVPSAARHPWAEFKIVSSQADLNAALKSAAYSSNLGLKNGSYQLPSALPNGVTHFAMGTNVAVSAQGGSLTGYDIELHGLTFTEAVTISGHGSYQDITFQQGWVASPTSGSMLFDHCQYDTHSITAGEYEVTVRNSSKLDGTAYTE